MSEQIPESTNHPEDNIKLQGPFTSNQVYNKQIQDLFINNQELNGQLQDPFTNNQPNNEQLQSPFKNNQEFNVQPQGPFINNQVYNGQLQQPSTNSQQVNMQTPKIRGRLCIFSTIILFIEICLNFYLIISDIFENGIIYGALKDNNIIIGTIQVLKHRSFYNFFNN